MIAGALVDAGAHQARLREVLESLGRTGYRLAIDKVVKQGLAATRFHVDLDPAAEQPHVHLQHVVDILRKGQMPERARALAIQIFERLGAAEAAVHGCPIENVHFHEVGAVDAILDITAACTALELLGIERVVCSPIPVGSGTIQCAHGVLPVPAPATARLLKGVPIAASEEEGELTTPTAAAVLTTLASSFGPMPAMTIQAIGHGAGLREGRRRPNVLRVLLGESRGSMAETADEFDTVLILETNLDDATPQTVAYCIERLLDAGALDAYALPIQMKKSRPAVLLTVLCHHQQAGTLETVLFRETPTLGIRRRDAVRTKLAREHRTVVTRFGPIRMKIGSRGTEVLVATPEYEDCRAAASRHGASFQEVTLAARIAWSQETRG